MPANSRILSRENPQLRLCATPRVEPSCNTEFRWVLRLQTSALLTASRIDGIRSRGFAGRIYYRMAECGGSSPRKTSRPMRLCGAENEISCGLASKNSPRIVIDEYRDLVKKLWANCVLFRSVNGEWRIQAHAQPIAPPSMLAAGRRISSGGRARPRDWDRAAFAKHAVGAARCASVSLLTPRQSCDRP